MPYRLLADIILILHFLWIAFLILGLPIGLYFKLPRVRILHALGMLFAIILQIVQVFCPLTIWEEQLRRHQQAVFSYRGSFIIYYLDKIVYPGWVSLKTIAILTDLLAIVTLVSLVVKPPWAKDKYQHT